MISIEKLVKNKKSRNPDIDTVKIVATPTDCKNTIGNETIKSSNETSMDDNDFVHVIKSTMNKSNKPVIVKIHSSNSVYLKKELRALRKLSDFPNSVKPSRIIWVKKPGKT